MESCMNSMPIRVKRIQMSDSANAMLALRYSKSQVAGEFPTSQKTRATIAIDNDGGGSSKLRVTVVVATVDETGTAGASTTYIYDGLTGGSGTVTAVTATLGELIAALALIPGITVERLNAAADYSLITNDFVDLAATDIRNDKLMECLYRDVSEIYYSAVRVGVPEPGDAGLIKLIGISGTVTGATAGTLTISKDPSKTDSTKEELVQSYALVNTTETKYWDFDMLNAPVLKGPLLIEASSSDLSAASILVRYVSVEV